MKIGMFMDDYYPSMNGVIMVMDNYAKRLNVNNEVVVIVPVFDKKYVDNFNYKVIRVKSVILKKLGYSFSTPLFDKGLEDRLIQEKFDIIHIHSPFIMGRLGVKIARKCNIPVVGTLHTLFSYEFDRIFKNKLIKKYLTNYLIKTYNMCDKCYTMNNRIKDIYYEQGLRTHVSIIPNATELTPVKDIKQARKYINKTYNLKDNEILLIFVGRVTIVKNILFIVESLQELKKAKLNFKMFFIGPLVDSDKLLTKINECGLENYVRIIGKITDREIIKDFFVRAELFLFPSVFDTSSLVQVEAASQMTPTLFVKNAPTAVAIKNNVNGFIGENDAIKYGQKILQILKDKKKLKEVSVKCYQDLYINWDDVTSLLLDNYNNIIKEFSNK